MEDFTGFNSNTSNWMGAADYLNGHEREKLFNFCYVTLNYISYSIDIAILTILVVYILTYKFH